jgi:hypothetical protein
MKSDVTATTHKERKPKKVLSHLEIHEGEDGGHVVKHNFTHYEHAPEEHVFGKGEGPELLAHVAKHMNIPAGGESAGSEEPIATKEAAEV